MYNFRVNDYVIVIYQGQEEKGYIKEIKGKKYKIQLLGHMYIGEYENEEITKLFK